MTFQDALARRGIRYRTSPGDRAKTHLCCPFCARRGKGGDSGFRLCVHAVQGWGRCVHCDWKSRSAVKAVLRELSITDSVDFAGSAPEEELPPVELPEDFQLLSDPHDELDREALRYLIDRGVTPAQIREKRIGVSYVGRYAYRIIFPVYVDGDLKGINARDFTGTSERKYLTNAGEKYLWGFDPRAETVVLAEGVFKALRLETATRISSAALLGHDLPERQREQIGRSALRRAILYPDPDLVGRRGFVKIADALSEIGIGVSVAWPVSVPADDAPPGDLREGVRKAGLYVWELSQKMMLGAAR